MLWLRLPQSTVGHQARLRHSAACASVCETQCGIYVPFPNSSMMQLDSTGLPLTDGSGDTQTIQQNHVLLCQPASPAYPGQPRAMHVQPPQLCAANLPLMQTTAISTSPRTSYPLASQPAVQVAGALTVYLSLAANQRALSLPKHKGTMSKHYRAYCSGWFWRFFGGFWQLGPD